MKSKPLNLKQHPTSKKDVLFIALTTTNISTLHNGPAQLQYVNRWINKHLLLVQTIAGIKLGWYIFKKLVALVFALALS